jgi:hypothetical protein
MSNKIPLDPNGVQPGFKVVKDAISNCWNYIFQLRDCSDNTIRFYGTDYTPPTNDTIAVFRIKITSTPLSIRLAQHAARGRFIHLINKPYA